jgi:hypothetical protein
LTEEQKVAHVVSLFDTERGWLEHAYMRHVLRTIHKRCRWVRDEQTSSVAGAMMTASDLAKTIEDDIATALAWVDALD